MRFDRLTVLARLGSLLTAFAAFGASSLALTWVWTWALSKVDQMPPEIGRLAQRLDELMMMSAQRGWQSKFVLNSMNPVCGRLPRVGG